MHRWERTRTGAWRGKPTAGKSGLVVLNNIQSGVPQYARGTRHHLLGPMHLSGGLYCFKTCNHLNHRAPERHALCLMLVRRIDGRKLSFEKCVFKAQPSKEEEHGYAERSAPCIRGR
jgi:hypothetical protein